MLRRGATENPSQQIRIYLSNKLILSVSKHIEDLQANYHRVIMAEWDEIKKLASDFQRTQTSDTLTKISERNCIDIVKKLIELKLIDVIYSCDGKEIITSDHLRKEIEDEVYVNGGRVHLSELAITLNVDHQHVQNKANDLVRQRPDEYSLILGQLIHSNYKVTLAEQIGAWVLAHEQLGIADFAKKLDLPTEFLLKMVKDILPSVVDDFVVSSDGRTFYTADLMNKYKSTIAGALSAITKPTSLIGIIKRLDITESIFMSIVEELIREGRIDAILEDRLLTPNSFVRKQNEYVDSFFSSNSYIEYGMLSRMDIKQPQTFLRRRFPHGIPLKTCFIGSELLAQVEGLIEDVISSKNWIDLSTILPPALQIEDTTQIIQSLFKSNKHFESSCLLFNQTIVCSLDFIETCRARMSEFMVAKATEQLKEGKLMQYFFGATIKKDKRVKDKEIDKGDKLDADKEKEGNIKEPVKNEEGPEQEKPVEHFNDDEQQHSKRKKHRKTKGDRSDDSDDEAKTSKKSKDKKTSGGYTGREVKQKNVKKKYFPGNKGAQRGSDHSDDEGTSSKVSRSNKGRAARRAISPDRSETSSKSKNPEPREPLIFMNADEIANKLKVNVRSDEEYPEEFLESLANMIERDLNTSYERVARQTLDEYIASKQSEEEGAEEVQEVF